MYWDLPWLYKLCTDTQFCYRITSSGGGKNRREGGDLRKIISTGIHQLSPNTGCSGAPDVGWVPGTKIKLNVSSRPRHNGGNLSRVSARRSHPDNEGLVRRGPGCQNLIITIQSPIIELAPPPVLRKYLLCGPDWFIYHFWTKEIHVGWQIRLSNPIFENIIVSNSINKCFAAENCWDRVQMCQNFWAQNNEMKICCCWEEF